jgi:tetratricopeptide (TPR) repeat protein
MERNENIKIKIVSGKRIIFLLLLSLFVNINPVCVEGVSASSISLRGQDARDTGAAKTNSCKVFRAMARVYMADGNYSKAQSLAENALRLAEGEKNPESEAQRSICLIDLAFLYKNLGKLTDAQKACEAGLELQNKIYYKDHPYIAGTLRILSSIYQGQAKYELAEATLNQAIEIMQKSHMADDPALAPFKVDMARLLAEMGKFDEAETLYLNALEVISKSYGHDHLYTSSVLGSLKELYTIQKRYEDAQALVEKTNPVQEKPYDSNPPIQLKLVSGIPS